MVPGAAWCLGALLGAASTATAEDCRLALVLALDVSSSVDSREHRLQREGLAHALLTSEVVRAFLAADPVALYIFEWNSPSTQAPLPPGWQIIRSEADLASVSATLTTLARGGRHDPHHSTALGAALAFAAEALQEGPDCRARTVDVSGDGVSNHGISPASVFDLYPFDAVTVNALVIGGAGNDETLEAWFRSEVLHGPSAFAVVARGYEDYARTMEAKLLRELEHSTVSGWAGDAKTGLAWAMAPPAEHDP